MNVCSTPTNDEILHACGLLPRVHHLYCQDHGSMGKGDYMSLAEVCPHCRKILFVVPEDVLLIWDEKEIV
jgi:ssDNA-binding Zn-finger/Zn-ribbon topoisomerase 1